jgi:5'-nucleotidase
VLVTNDDGVESPGLKALAVELHGAGNDVFVVAPSGERSGSGAAIGRLHRAGRLQATGRMARSAGCSRARRRCSARCAVYAGCLGARDPPTSSHRA